MKKLIAGIFALTILGAGAAVAQIHVNIGNHHHRHQVCSWHHHHKSCHWA